VTGQALGARGSGEAWEPLAALVDRSHPSAGGEERRVGKAKGVGKASEAVWPALAARPPGSGVGEAKGVGKVNEEVWRALVAA
jgi:hypothetical protein